MNRGAAVIETGWVYRNPKPYLRSIVAYHPSLVRLDSGELFASFDLGEAVEALDYHTIGARSQDGGNSWQVEGPLLSKAPPRTTHTIRTSLLRDGSLVGFGGMHHRDDPEAGLVNRETFGLVPIDLFLIRSHDGGRIWTEPAAIAPPFIGPSWEICHPILELRSGRWLAPTATWRAWNGENPSGDQAVVLISDDQGRTWPAFGRSFDGRRSGHSHFEQSVMELRDGRLLAVSWVFDSAKGATLPTIYALSSDQGLAFGQPAATGFLAQTCKLLELRDGRLFCAYRRHDSAGLWATLARLEGEKWLGMEQHPLWLGAESGMSGRDASGEELSALRFGYPSMKQVSETEVLLLFWCQEDCITGIRWMRIQVG